MDFNDADTWRWIWLAAAVVFTLGELLVAGSFFLAPFAIGAGAACVAAFLGGPVAVGWAVFVGVSLAASLVLRPLARKLDASSPVSTVGVHRWADREGVVIEDIPAGVTATGLVRLEREEWRAQSDDGTAIATGTTVVVRRVDGTRLVVTEKT